MHLLSDKLIRYAVVVLVTPQIDTAVRSHLHVSIAPDLKVFCRKWKQIGPVHCQETLFTGIGMLLHTLLVMRLHLLSSGPVKLFNGVEYQITKLGIYTLVHQLDVILYEALVLGMQWSGGLYETSVVIGHILEHLVDGRLIAVCLHDGSLEVVWYEDLRYTSDMFEELGDGIFSLEATVFCL